MLTGGKTGTTQAYRDAWFCGFTGNFTAAVRFGNGDYTSTNNMTGGSLPAMTFKLLMDFAHQGIELRPLPEIENPLLPATDPKTAATEAKRRAEEAKKNNEPTLVRPRMLTASSTRLLREIGEKLKQAPVLKLPEKLAEAG